MRRGFSTESRHHWKIQHFKTQGHGFVKRYICTAEFQFSDENTGSSNLASVAPRTRCVRIENNFIEQYLCRKQEHSVHMQCWSDRHRGPSSYTVALIGFATRRSLPAKFHINKKIWRPKNSTTVRNRESNSLFLTVEFFLLQFFSGWTFVGKLQVPTKLPKVLLLFNNIYIVKGY